MVPAHARTTQLCTNPKHPIQPALHSQSAPHNHTVTCTYTQAATICPCPIIQVDTPGTLRMCEYSNLLRSAI